MTGLKFVAFVPEDIGFLVETSDSVEAVNKAIAAHWSLAYRYPQYRRRERALDRRNYFTVDVNNMTDLFYSLNGCGQLWEMRLAYGVVMLV